MILNALFHHGSKVSTKFLSENLSIPSRTINYRIRRLKENGFLHSYPMLDERKLGLGTSAIIIQENQERRTFPLHDLLERVPYFYLIASTYGKYTGCLFFSVYSLETPGMINDFLEILKEQELASEYYVLDIIDNITGKVDLSYYDTEENRWKWDWE
ncbi:MAG: hypothetical protein ACFFD4_39960, partial [Candidatus Odinarchaeota archaeon]